MLEIINIKDDLNLSKKLENIFPSIFNSNGISNNLNSNPFTNYFILKLDEEIIGFINYDIIYDRVELININIVSEYKGNGYGNKLMNFMFSNLDKSIKNISLEVRKDNFTAINMYKKFGFIEKAIRKNYYDGVDGILMVKEL